VEAAYEDAGVEPTGHAPLGVIVIVIVHVDRGIDRGREGTLVRPSQRGTEARHAVR
jgi:hypothetical protein